ncbi:PREDICTED: uncharacterized protein LOC104727972 [Camelina sativa]|uniref:Uncharacterized protein LOC104727972 n=1 Tax=Camelina sativa TaxID=90675 RepID=A0ABM0US35_CAMSA|nr:PREDICTED: uncharacterized protein LOC104727972 [Camelina sativa]
MATGDDFRILSGGNHDATMDEIGEQGRPPGEPPDGLGSWVRKFPNGEDGEPVVTIGKEVLDAMNGLWKNCMIVKVLGRTVPIAALSRRLREMWKPSGSMFVVDLPRQFFIIRFGEEEEYMAALTGGPWRMFGSYLLVQAWTPEFDPLRDEISTTLVWIRLTNIPLNFYHKNILFGVTRGLGNPIRVDGTTSNCERTRFAIVCVEVNLKRPMKGTIMINGERNFVAYEGLNTICLGCGMYGHLIHSCPQRVQHSEVVVSTQVVVSSPIHTEAQQGMDGFVPVK